MFAAYSSYNGSRSNKPYGTASPTADVRKITLPNLDRGGDLTDEPDSSNYSFSDRWQTWIGRRGDVARAMFYMDVRYEGGQNANGEHEPDLQLTDDISKVVSLDVWEQSGTAFMGLLPALLEWHQQDPVDDLERRRNGMVSVDIGVSEPGNTPVGQSLQLTGQGSQAADFTCAGPAAATRGTANAGQTFTPAP